MSIERAAHSPLGGSGAERWMHCPGSVDLLKRLRLPESDDPSYRAQGTAMHQLAEDCLKNGIDTWERTGVVYTGVEIDRELALATQVYVDYCRAIEAEETFIEFPISAPAVHEQFYGTADFVALGWKRRWIEVVDLKGGVGINVEPDGNPQLKYYAFGVIHGLEVSTGQIFPDETEVKLTIVQPRIPYGDAIKQAEPITVGDLKDWTQDDLIPAMQATEIDGSLEAGEWCRFCPAKLVCPLMKGIFGAAAVASTSALAELNDAQIAREYGLIQGVKFYIKTLEQETLRRLLQGASIPTAKLVNKKANRVWKPEAAELATAAFGEQAWTREIKSPPQLEKLGPQGLEFVKRYAYTPHTGITLAPIDDPRHAVTVKPAEEVFKAALEKIASEA